ncbi:hypothetical protein [Pseudogemmobacter bohemicus]|uniref:hypothetical protein n=1 Tax=Pseudogemmobacter bohemicus TaxID=2250708 RepID=UPI000DD2D2DA|nr:hypothetical protein [Pseudogemmobacter bohemicus]
MPKVSLTSASGWVVIGPLAATSDFQVRRGACLFTTEAPGADTDFGFDRREGETWTVGSGKTVRLRAGADCLVHYEALA